jgi:anti-repressor protein
MPTQKSMELGLFTVKERAIDNPDGSIFVTRTTKVTGRGYGKQDVMKKAS